LKDHSKTSAHLKEVAPVERRNVFTEHSHLTGGRLEQPHNVLHDDRFSGTASTDEDRRASWIYSKVHAFEHVVLTEALVEINQLYHRCLLNLLGRRFGRLR